MLVPSAAGGAIRLLPIMTSPPDPLDGLLDRWQQTPTPPSNLAPEVWRRIAVAESRAETPGLFARIETAFSRPSFATAFVTVCVLLGLFLAQMRLSRLEAAHSAQLAQSYLRLIDPLISQTDVPPSSRNP